MAKNVLNFFHVSLSVLLLHPRCSLPTWSEPKSPEKVAGEAETVGNPPPSSSANLEQNTPSTAAPVAETTNGLLPGQHWTQLAEVRQPDVARCHKKNLHRTKTKDFNSLRQMMTSKTQL